MRRFNRKSSRHVRTGVVAVQVALSLTFIFGMAALSVDIARLYTAHTEMQVAADAAALAATAELGRGGNVVAKADEYARYNTPKGLTLSVASADVELGNASFSPTTGKYAFVPGGSIHDAVRVHVRRAADGGPVEVPYLFAPVINFNSKRIEAQASAVLLPRDISLVNDASNSMSYDSTLTSSRVHRTDGGYSNLRDIWCALNGPQPDRPYVPATSSTVDQTQYQTDTGPTYGEMKTWGSALVPGTYSATSDSGLWYIKPQNTTTLAAITSNLTARGYSSAERDALMKGASYDGGSVNHSNTNWRNRTKVILGLYDWKSGKVGGKFPSGGDGDNKVESNEIVQIVPSPSFALDWTWEDYLNYVPSGRVSNLEYRWGLKTLVDFMLANQPGVTENNILWATPQQPMRAIKDAVQAMTDFLEEQQSQDHMALEIFCGKGSLTKHEIDLTDDFSLVTEAYYGKQAGNYEAYTNIGGGLYWAIHELMSERARSTAAKVIVLMSDGAPNRWDARANLPGIDDWDDPDNPQSWSDPSGYARAMARIAARNNIRIYAVSVGIESDHTLMQELAEIGEGEEFLAAGNPVEYAGQLRDLFQRIAGKRPVALID